MAAWQQPTVSYFSGFTLALEIALLAGLFREAHLPSSNNEYT